MTWRLLHLGVFALTLAVAWPAQVPGATLPDADNNSTAACLEPGRSPTSSADETETSGVRQGVPARADALSEERLGQFRSELRHLALKVWLAPGAIVLANKRLPIIRFTWAAAGLRIHMLLCTWLN